MNVDARDLTAVRDRLLQVPNERLAAHAPVDTTGDVQHIELHPIDRARWMQQTYEPIFILHHAPTVLVQIHEDESDTGLGAGIVAVEAIQCQPFTLDVELADERCSRARSLKVRAIREQIPLTIATASTLYTLQGTTATPGLIYHFRTPRRISALMKWISTYMALSRVQSRKQLRSIGMTAAIKDLINGGPPAGFLTRFLMIFGEKISETADEVDKAMAELGWLAQV